MEIVQHQNRNKQTIITNPNHNYPQPYPYNGGNQYDPGYDPNFQPQGGQPYLQHNPIQKNEPQGYFGAGFQQPQQQNGPILY